MVMNNYIVLFLLESNFLLMNANSNIFDFCWIEICNNIFTLCAQNLGNILYAS